MKRVLPMIILSLFPRVLAAQGLDIAGLEGEHWYGLYMNGQKTGCALQSLERGDGGAITVVEDARFKLTMAGIRQDMRIHTRRTYAPDGPLEGIVAEIDDVGGRKRFEGRVDGDTLRLEAAVGGATQILHLPKPKESLRDALKLLELAGRDGAQVGDEIAFSMFEPLYQQEIEGVSRIAGVAERVLDGVATTVYEIRTTSMGIESVSFVTQQGVTLEDVMAGILTMRLEPEETACDVDYTNDVVVSSAARLDKPIADPRGREALELRLTGPLTPHNLFTDDRQRMNAEGDHVAFAARRVTLDGVAPATLPVEDEALRRWLEPTLFIQSDDPRLVAQAREIVGDETNTLEISNRLCAWVHEHVRTTYSARLTNALEVLDQREGDCTEQSILFIGLARAVGLPAREAAGLVYVEGDDPGFYFHQWASAWVGRWIDVDPTFNQPLADVTHIKLAEGNLLQQTRLLPVIGQLRIEVAGEEDDAG